MVTSVVQQLSFIPFNQTTDVFEKLNVAQHQTLIDLDNKYQGLCDLICNRILIDNIIGCGRDQDYLKNRITIESLNESEITNSHMLDVYSIFQRAIALLFGILPDNIFSIQDQWRLVDSTKSVDQEILAAGLETIENDETLKLVVFKYKWLGLEGHSLLMKKLNNNHYILFNPYYGEYRNLSFSELSSKINEALIQDDATNIFITRGEDYLNRLGL